MLLSVFLGSGVQVLIMTIVTLGEFSFSFLFRISFFFFCCRLARFVLVPDYLVFLDFPYIFYRVGSGQLKLG